MTESIPDFKTPEEFIAHYGVPGMKWGKRKSRSAVSSTGKRAKTRNLSNDAERARRIKQKPMSQRSNKELRTLNERQQLQKTSAQLNPGKLATGKKKADAVLAGIGTVTAISAILLKKPKGGDKTYAQLGFEKVRELW